jgi:hypothetical protein
VMQEIQDLKLHQWQEIIGKCIKASKNGENVTIVVETNVKPRRYRLSIPLHIENPRTYEGNEIAILRTDNDFLVRKIEENKTNATTENTAYTEGTKNENR